MTVSNIQPTYDYLNGGWVLAGADSSLWATFASGVDSNYAKVPASKGVATVGFPVDSGAIPSGAQIQSVSLAVRASLGSGTPTAGQPASLTCSMMSKADPTQYYQRTIRPTNASGSPQTFTVANYTRHPSGNPWDMEMLNDLMLQVFSYNMVSDLVRVYEVFYAVYYSSAPVLTVTAPTGTVNTSAPTLMWTYSQSDGDFQASAEYRIFTDAQKSDPSFGPDVAAPVAEGVAKGTAFTCTLGNALPSGTYWAYMRGTSETKAVSGWDGKQFTVAGVTPGVPGIQDPTGVAPAGQGIASLVPDDVNGCAVLTVQDTSNLLGRHMSDVNISDLDQSWITSNCSVAESTDYTFPGDTGQIWKLTATASGNMSVTTHYVSVLADGGDLTALGQVLAKTTGRSVRVDISYVDSSYNSVSTVTGVATTDSTSWSPVSTVDTATPAAASKARATYTFLSCAASEVHYLTHAGILYGNQTQWSNGGMASRNLLDSWYSNCSGTQPSTDAWVAGVGTTVSTATATATAGYDGAPVNKMTCSSVAPTIALRAAGTVFSTATAGTSYTLNKPSSAASGDLMVAFVTSTSPIQTGFAAPTGWQLVELADAAASSSDAISMAVLARSAGASEPSTWTGSLPFSAARCSAVVVAYSGAADVSSQFIAEAQAPSALAGTVFSTATVANTDPSAWRISAFATDSAVSAATMTANTQAPGGNPIQYVGSSTWGWQDHVASFTINKPSGVVAGDLMIATVCADVQNGIYINAPAGWTTVRSYSGGSPWTTATMVLKRTAGASEPSSWTGTLSATPTGDPFPKVTTCLAYRNCDVAANQFVADGATNSAGYPTLWSPGEVNTNASAWAVGAFTTLNSGDNGANTLTARSGSGIATPQQRVSERWNSGGGDDVLCAMMSDSNGPTATGSFFASAHSTVQTTDAFAWVGYLAPAPAGTPPANETSRVSSSTGTAAPWDNLAVFDSNGPVTASSWSVTATSSATYKAIAGWIGLIRPSTSSVNGVVSAKMQSPVDISSINDAALQAAGNAIVAGASFIGSSSGTALITVDFYRANVQISSMTQVAGQFNGSSGNWADCSAQFAMPDGTTRVDMGISVNGRNVGDYIEWNRTFLNLGVDPSYVPGSSAAAHPVWSHAEIQCADNTDGTGFGDWRTVPGTLTNTPTFGTDKYLVFRDHTIIPLVPRKYRMRTVSYGLNGDVFASGWGPDSNAMTFQAQNWWLKDIGDPANNVALKVKWADLPITRQNTAIQFQALGEQYPVVLTDGMKSDTFTLTLIPVDQTDHVLLLELLASNKTLYLQSDIDQAWWVRPIGDVKRTILATDQRQSTPLRQIEMNFVEVGPVA